jgi:hypothetical protein
MQNQQRQHLELKPEISSAVRIPPLCATASPLVGFQMEVSAPATLQGLVRDAQRHFSGQNDNACQHTVLVSSLAALSPI